MDTDLDRTRPVSATGPDFDSLSAIGLSRTGEDLYRVLVAGPDLTATQLSAQVARSPGTVRRALDELVALGLVSRRATGGYVANPPDLAIGNLILRRQEALQRCRAEATSLLAQYRASMQIPMDVVELIRGRDKGFECYTQMLNGARSEVLMFDKPPYLGPVDNPLEIAALERGVAWRAIYDPTGLEAPERLAQLEAWAAAGEQARVYAPVPLKLVLVDRASALLPLTADSQGATHTSILVHQSALLTTLAMLFDMLWKAALPIDHRKPADAGDADPITGFDRQMLTMLTSGAKDQSIANQLHVSVRTVRRRITTLMADCGVTTRFQLGVAAGRQGWL